MKRKRRKLTVLCLLLATVITAVPVFGDTDTESEVQGTAQMDGIKATITTDKQQYEDEEEIQFSLHIENDSEATISSANVSYDISNGLCVLDSNKQKKKNAKFGKVSSGKEKVIFGNIGKDPKETILPFVPPLYTVFVTGVAVLVFLCVIMILYYVFARNKMGKWWEKHHRCFLIFAFAGMLLTASSAHVLAKEETAKHEADLTLSPVVVVSYGEDEVVIRADISLYLTE